MSNKIDYWLELCDDDLETAKGLLSLGRLLHMGFFCHLIAEKALKAVVSHKTAETPPKTHDLKRLADLGDVFNDLLPKHIELLKHLTPLHIEARYPEHKEKLRASLRSCIQLINFRLCGHFSATFRQLLLAYPLGTPRRRFLNWRKNAAQIQKFMS